MAATTFIYGLSDPISGMVRYIGKTNNPRQRYNKHLLAYENNHKASWIKSLKMNGLLPGMEIIDEVSKKDWQKKEIEYIKLFKACGAKLVNGTLGGEGAKVEKQSKEWIEKRIKGYTGKKLSKEHCSKLSKNHSRKIKVYQFDMAGKFIKEWDSAQKVQNKLNISKSNILNCCRNKKKRSMRNGKERTYIVQSAGNFKWRFKK